VESQESMKIPISLDDPLGALHHLAAIISGKPMAIPWDFDVFWRDIGIPLYLHQ